MYWIFLLFIMGICMKSGLSACLSDLFPLANYCPANYEQARKAFVNAVEKNESVTQHRSFCIGVKSHDETDLFIDIAVLGHLKNAKKILFHISGTHGVEGGAGSGIQNEFISNPIDLPKDLAIIFIHTLNPYGMAWNRRVNELNIDLNRNCTDIRLTSDLYPIIDPLFNPKSPIKWNTELFHQLCSIHGWDKIRNALIVGQYDFSEGLFYGGKEIAPGPKLVLNWCLSELKNLDMNFSERYFGIIDVHSGLGPYGIDTLLTIEPPTEFMLNIFGEKMSVAVQMATTGYQATGCFVSELAKCIQDATQCPSSHIYIVGQEFGTINEEDVWLALYDENVYFHHAKRIGVPYNPNEAVGKAMLRAFYPADRAWRHAIVSAGRQLLLQFLNILNLSGMGSEL